MASGLIMLIQSSTSPTFAETSRAFLGSTTFPEASYTPSDLSMTVTVLPASGTVLLADGFTPVCQGQTLTLAQLAALRFRPAPGEAAAPSALDLPAAGSADPDPAATLPERSPVFSIPENSGARTIGIRIAATTNHPPSDLYAIVTELPSNGTVLLSDGISVVARGQTLQARQLKRLRFRPTAGAAGQISNLSYLLVDPAGRAVAGWVLLIVTPGVPAWSTPLRRPAAPGAMAGSIVTSFGLAAFLDMSLSSASSSELDRSMLPATESGAKHGKEREHETLEPAIDAGAEEGPINAVPAHFAAASSDEPSLISDNGAAAEGSEKALVADEDAEHPERIGSSSLPLATALARPSAISDAAFAPVTTQAAAAPAVDAPFVLNSSTPPNLGDGLAAARPMASLIPPTLNNVPFVLENGPAPLANPPASPSSPLTAAPVPPSGGGAAPAPDGSSTGSPTAEIDAWSAHWRAAAAAAPCGSCAGMACGTCSIVTGGPARANGLPTGYDPASIVRQIDTTVGGANDLSGPTGGLLTPSSQSAAATASLNATATNAIVLENMLPGTPESEWLIDFHDPTIEGYAAQFSVDNGQRVDFKINTDSTNYRIEIYRIGYYGGAGARRVATIERNLTAPQVQPVPLFDPTRRLVDAGNWSVSASWDVPADAVSGVYFARLERLDGQGGANMIPFIVRDDENPSDITFQTSDTTWQAYNWWGGYNLYGGIDQPGRDGRASAVSYNRPFITRDGGFAAGPQDFIFSVEYPTIRWLEQNGYDVNYISGIDTARSGAQLLNSEVFLSVGHDEYWSAGQRSNVEAARDAGVNLAFLSGNEVYWEVRWENSIDGTGTPFKTMVSYKERWDRANTDTNGTTSTWRDFQLGSGRPENALTGTIFTVDSYRLDTITIPYNLSNFRFWSNTAVDDIQPGQVYSLVPNLLGYEWDSDLDNGYRPAGLIQLSSTTVDVPSQLLLDYGNTVGAGTASHSLTLYRAPSGALVFGAGTVYWSWGLDANHDNEITPTDPNVQQAMVNLFADMGVQPATLMASLAAATQTTDNTRPTTTITSPATSPSYIAGQPITINGTATDGGGGIVAVVEVSTDGGTTWHRATGFENWSYTWTPLANGSYTIRSRAVDDSVNMEVPGAGRTISVGPAPVWSLIPQSATPEVQLSSDAAFVNLGVSFTSSQAGTIAGLRYYKSLGDGGEHVGSLWTSTGTLLASATFTGETASGWQTVTFDNPVSIAAGTTYVASYRSSGHYPYTLGYFDSPVTNGPLTAGDGYFTYGVSNTFPTTATNGTSYFVDVIFTPLNTPNQAPTAVNDGGFELERDTPMTFAASTLLANDSDPNGDFLSVVGAGSASGGTVSFNNQTGAVTFTPNAGYTGPASFSYTISDGRGGTSSAVVSMLVTPPLPRVSLFSSSDTPEVLSDTDASQVNLGVRFVSSVAGTITGIRYYRGVNDLGTHTGSLWTSTGTLLATATFTNETASGWQQVNFATPVSITAGTTYVASYHSNGHYAATAGYFSSNHVNGPLTAAAGNNGVYAYGSANLFPNNTFGATNYWVDVVFASSNMAPVAVNDSGFNTTQNTARTIAASALLANDSDPNNDPLTITGVSGAVNGTVSFNSQTNIITFTPTNGHAGSASFNYTISDARGGTATATVGLTVNPQQPPVAANDSGFSAQRNTTLTIAAAALLANDSDPNDDPLTITGVGGAVNGTVAFNSQTNTVSFTPASGYTGPASFNYSISDGKGGTSSAAVALDVTLPVNNVSLFSGSETPANLSTSDTSQVNLGMRFVSSMAGTITGIRYYRGANDLGTHTGSLWTSTGTLLATATFTNETASGWQQVNFATPVSITAGTTYVASYHSNGRYTSTPDYFNTSRVNGPLTAPAGNNGVYAYGNGNLFPNNTFNETNYWVDVVFAAPGAANQLPVAVNDSGFTTAQNTPLTIAASALLANDSDPNGDPLTITGVSGAVNGSVSFDSQANSVSFTPTTGYTGQASFTYSIADGNGGSASATASLFVTQPATTTSFFSASHTPSIVAVNDASSVELGFKFQSSTNGEITGMRFYKAAQNTGPHVANLWTSTGSLLATATFTNETSSGWQQVNFTTPVTITAGTTYVASYHTNGFYSADPNYFATSQTSGPLTAPSSSSIGGNGVYAYGSSSLFPTNSFNSTSYGVDVLFRAQLAA